MGMSTSSIVFTVLPGGLIQARGPCGKRHVMTLDDAARTLRGLEVAIGILRETPMKMTCAHGAETTINDGD